MTIARRVAVLVMFSFLDSIGTISRLDSKTLAYTFSFGTLDCFLAGLGREDVYSMLLCQNGK